MQRCFLLLIRESHTGAFLMLSYVVRYHVLHSKSRIGSKTFLDHFLKLIWFLKSNDLSRTHRSQKHQLKPAQLISESGRWLTPPCTQSRKRSRSRHGEGPPQGLFGIIACFTSTRVAFESLVSASTEGHVFFNGVGGHFCHGASNTTLHSFPFMLLLLGWALDGH